jgi:transcriptional regulator GlxA family with amidase domain
MTGTIGSAVQYGHADEIALAERFQTIGTADPMLPLGLDDNLVDQRDERIRTALTVLHRDPRGRLSAADVARMVNLSPSRFQHLFTTHAGTSFRRYRSWSRMLHVAAAVNSGKDLTTASADAGFASPAHFSDSFRATFGLSASRLLAAGAEIRLPRGE